MELPQEQTTKKQNNLDLIYNQAASKFEVPPPEEFYKAMKIPKNRELVFRQLSQFYDMPKFEVFDQSLVRDLDPLSSFRSDTPVDAERLSMFDKALNLFGMSNIVENRKTAEEAVRQTKGLPKDSNIPTLTPAFGETPFAPMIPPPKDAGEFLSAYGKSLLGDPIATASIHNLATRPTVKFSHIFPERLSAPELDALFLNSSFSRLNEKSKRGLWGFIRDSAKFAEGLTSPENILLMFGLMKAPAGAGQLLSGIFSAEMASNVPGEVAAFAKAMKEGDPESAGGALAGILENSAFAALAAKSALGRSIKPSPMSDEVVNKIKALPEPSFIPAKGDVALPKAEVPKAQLALPEPSPKIPSPGNKTLSDLINDSIESIAQHRLAAGKEVKALPSPSFIQAKGTVQVTAEPAIRVGSVATDIPIEGTRGVDISLRKALREKYKDDVEAFERDFDELPREQKSILFDLTFNKGEELNKAIDLVLRPKGEVGGGKSRSLQTPPNVSGKKESIFGGTPGVSGISAKEAAAQAKGKFESPTRPAQLPPPVMRTHMRDEIFRGTTGVGDVSARDALKQAAEDKLTKEDIESKSSLQPPQVNDPITSHDIRLKLIQQGKDLGNLTVDDINLAKEEIIKNRQEINDKLGHELDPRDREPDLRNLQTTEDVDNALSEMEGFGSRLKSYAKEWSSRLASTFSVEHPFKKEGAPLTGIMVKNFGSQLDLRAEMGRKVALKIAKSVDRDPRLLTEVVRFAENPALFKTAPRELQMKLAQPVRDLLKYFSDARELYEKRGYKIDFKDRIKRELESQISLKTSLGEDVSGLRVALEKLKNFNFIHIPTSLWFERAAKSGDNNIGRIFSVLAEQKRTVFSIEDLLERGLIKPADINAVDIIMNYSRRLGKDLALLDITNAGVKEGLAFPIKKGEIIEPPFVKPSVKAPVLRGFAVHNVLNDLLIEMSKSREGVGVFQKGFSLTKALQFFNPLYLPMNDIKQAIMAGSISPLRPFSSVNHMVMGIVDVLTHSKKYEEAGNLGAFSTPYVISFKSFNEYIESIKTKPGDKVAALVKSVIKLNPWPSIKAFYDASQGISWSLDRMTRMGTYRFYLSKGFSPLQAAQATALAHGDYPSVPARTRRAANFLFFTPTFKIAMSKFFGDMVKASYETVQGAFGKDIDPTAPLRAMGLVRTIGLILAIDLYMKSKGFEGDILGYRYSKRTNTEKGPEDIVVTIPGPENLPIKFGARVKEAFRPGEETPLVRFYRAMKWEMSVPLRIGSEIATNRDSEGNIIYNPFGESPTDRLMRAANITKYAIFNSVRLLKEVEERTIKDSPGADAREVLTREVGKLNSLAMQPFTFSYLREPEEIRIRSRLERVQARFQQLIKDGQIAVDSETERQFVETIGAISEELKTKEGNVKLSNDSMAEIKALGKAVDSIIEDIDDLQHDKHMRK